MKFKDKMNIAEIAFTTLFPNKHLTRKLEIVYSGKFKDYNGNVRYTSSKMTFGLSKSWKSISPEIQIGLIQSLLLKVYKEKIETINIDLYNEFLKNISKYSVPTQQEPELVESFNRMNELYFNNYMDMPNLIWGQKSLRKLGHYHYASDTIMISQVLSSDQTMLDYVMYHEMLHKDLKFETKNGRNFHHTPEFKRREKLFYEPDIEKKLTIFLRKKKLGRAFGLI